MRGNKILNVLFPPRCAVCDDVLGLGEEYICSKCKTRVIYVREPSCFKCGRSLEKEESEYCPDCSSKKRSFVRGFPVFSYEAPLSDSLMRFKYEGRQEYAGFFANSIAQKYENIFPGLKIDALIPVPINKKKYSNRGYNQATLVSNVLGKKLGVPVREDIVIRTVDTPPQKELTSEERERNLKGAFSPCHGMSKDKVVAEGIKTVLLVDDIYTTGATIESCTRVCHTLGIKNVYYTSVAIVENL